MKRRRTIDPTTGLPWRRGGGKSTFKKALRTGAATIHTPARTGMSDDGGGLYPPEPGNTVPAKSTDWRIATYNAHRGVYAGVGGDQVTGLIYLGPTRARERQHIYGVTARQRRRIEHKHGRMLAGSAL